MIGMPRSKQNKTIELRKRRYDSTEFLKTSDSFIDLPTNSKTFMIR